MIILGNISKNNHNGGNIYSIKSTAPTLVTGLDTFGGSIKIVVKEIKNDNSRKSV